MTHKTVPRSDWAGFAYPKNKRIKVRPDAAEMPEKDIQEYADKIFSLANIPSLHFPAEMFRAISTNPYIKGGVKAWVFSVLSGYPDNLCFLPLCEYYNTKIGLYLAVEHKTRTKDGKERGKLHGSQKVRAEELGFNICRSPEEADKLLAAFKAFHAYLDALLRTSQGSPSPRDAPEPSAQ